MAKVRKRLKKKNYHALMIRVGVEYLDDVKQLRRECRKRRLFLGHVVGNLIREHLRNDVWEDDKEKWHDITDVLEK